MKFRWFALAVMLLGILAFLLGRYRHEQPRGEIQTAATGTDAGEAAASVPANTNTPVAPAKQVEAAAVERRRGLWRIEPETGVISVSDARSIAWKDWSELKNRVIAEWKKSPVDLDFTEAPLSSIPGVLMSQAALTLRIDEGCDPDNLTATFKVSRLNAWDSLDLMAKMADVRVTVGTDGVVWLVPKDERAACEPECPPEFEEWDLARSRHESSVRFDEEEHSLASKLATLKVAVELREVPLKQALDSLETTFAVSIYCDEDHFPASVYEIERDADLNFPLRKVTFVKAEASLGEALTAILAPLDLAWSATSMIVVKSREEVAAAAEKDKELSQRVAEGGSWIENEMSRLHAIRIHLDGRSLTLTDLAGRAAEQAGISFRVDPLLACSTARWDAVEAELTLGELLAEIAAGGGCQCVIELAAWPAYQEPYEEGWRLWVMAPGHGK